MSISVEIDSTCSTEPPAAGQAVARRFEGAANATWAIAEQGTFSLSNWLLQALLVRWLADEAAFGAFSVAFAWFLLAGTVHNSLVVEPMMVYGGKRYAAQIRKYFGTLVGGSLAVSLLVATLLGGVGLGYAAIGQSGVAIACWSLAGALPFVFLSWLMRRTSYVTQRPHRSAIAGLAYLVTMVAGFFALKEFGLFRVPTATAVMALAALIASAWLLWIERVDRPGHTADVVTGDRLAAGVRSDHWRFGRWMLLSGLAGMVASQWYYLTLPWFAGVESGGALRALSNLFQPIVQAIVAFTAIIVPVLVAAVGTPRYQHLVRRALLLMTFGPLAAWLLCALASDWIVDLVYSGRYADDAHLLWLIGLQPAVAGFIAVRHAQLCVADRPDRMFAASAAALVFTLTVGTGLMYLFGLWGVVAALLGAMIVDALVSLYYVRTGLRPTAGPRMPSDGLSGGTRG